MARYRLIENPQDGEIVTFVGCHAVQWKQEWGRPDVAFAEIEDAESAKDDLISRRGVVEKLREVASRQDNSLGYSAAPVLNALADKFVAMPAEDSVEMRTKASGLSTSRIPKDIRLTLAEIWERHRVTKFAFEGQQPPRAQADIDTLLQIIDSPTLPEPQRRIGDQALETLRNKATEASARYKDHCKPFDEGYAAGLWDAIEELEKPATPSGQQKFACTECRYVFTETEIAAEDKNAWGHPCHGVDDPPDTVCESFRQPLPVLALPEGGEQEYAPCPDERCNDTKFTIPQCVTAVLWAERYDEAVEVLRETAKRFDGIDSGTCKTCTGGFRLYDTKGSPQACDNKDCLSHRITAVLNYTRATVPVVEEKTNERS